MISYKENLAYTQLLHFYSEIFKSLDNGSPVDVVLVDFRKAFDIVPHSELLFKLWSLGITGSLFVALV